MSKRFLSAEDFQRVVDSTPLVSIDLIVCNADGDILLGKRNNRPAQGFWFVPGGRIQKNEKLVDAFKRLTTEELGLCVEMQNARYLGLYEHFYEDSIFTESQLAAGKENISTHYVVNAFEIVIDSKEIVLPREQHNEYVWLSEKDLLASDQVHVHSKWYFMSSKGIL